MFILTKTISPKSSRDQIRLRGVKNDILLLPNNKYRIVLEVSSINFELRSEAEQDLIIDNYQNFLNSLPCSMQILFRIRAMDLDKYINTFEDKIRSENSAIQKKRLKDYNQFVRDLVSNSKILSRTFYIILPIDNEENSDMSMLNQQFRLLEDIIQKGLDRLGMKTRRLSGLEMLDLFYSFYNPEKSKSQSITSQTLNMINKAYL